MTLKQILLVVAMIYTLWTMIYWFDDYFGYSEESILPFSPLIGFYLLLILYGIVFLMTGSTKGRDYLKIFTLAYQVFMYITITLLLYFYLSEGTTKLTLGIARFIIVYTFPQGIYSLALEIAIFEELQPSKFSIQCKYIINKGLGFIFLL